VVVVVVVVNRRKEGIMTEIDSGRRQ